MGNRHRKNIRMSSAGFLSITVKFSSRGRNAMVVLAKSGLISHDLDLFKFCHRECLFRYEGPKRTNILWACLCMHGKFKSSNDDGLSCSACSESSNITGCIIHAASEGRLNHVYFTLSCFEVFKYPWKLTRRGSLIECQLEVTRSADGMGS